MKRIFEEKLLNWKNTDMKKPLMVIGARQIGKTYIIEKFAKENFEEYIYINLEKEESIKEIFENSIDPDVIIKNIELHLGKRIDLENTLLFFDEVQVSEKFIVSLKYFNESSKEYKIICAGSLLGVKINRFNSSFPVGKIRIEQMTPMNFEEFLMACNKDILLSEIRNSYNNFTPLPEFAHKEALELYKSYLCIGGMPEAVNNFIENNMNILMFDNKILNNIIDMYIADMTKYVNNISESIKIEKIYKSIPTQLANENRKFKYTNVEENGRKRMYENPLEWLIASKMILICNSVKRVEIPLKVYSDENSFKIYLSDIGLLTNLSEIKLTDIMLDTPFIFKGALVENFVAQELQSKENSLYYWTLNNSAEVDFLYYSKNDGIIPIEVKAGNNIKSTSLNTYIEKHNPKYAIRLSTKNFGFENNIKSIPLYATFCID